MLMVVFRFTDIYSNIGSRSLVLDGHRFGVVGGGGLGLLHQLRTADQASHKMSSLGALNYLIVTSWTNVFLRYYFKNLELFFLF